MDIEKIESCSICMDSYDEEVRPRCLPCGHNFCGACLKNSIKNGSLKCSHCQKSHGASSANDFPINYGMEAVISQMRELKLGAISRDQSSSAFRLLQPGGKWQVVFNDQKDSLRNLMALSNTEVGMHHYKDFIHQIKGKHEQILFQIYDLEKKHEEITKQLEVEDRTLTDAMQERKEYLKKANETLSKYNKVQNAIEFAVGSDEVACCCDALEEWERKNKIQWPNAKIIHMSDKLLTRATSISKDVLSEGDEDSKENHDLSTSTLPIMEKLNRIRGIIPVTPKDLQAKSESAMNLLKEGLVYGIQIQEGKIRTAKISMENSRIYLHCLKDEDLPFNARTIQHSELIECLNKDCVTVFMDLCWEGSVRGRLHILLSPDTPLARHFRCLCCGDSGPSYAQTTFHRVECKGNAKYERIAGGDYQFGNGSGGAPLKNGLKPKDEIYKRIWEAGIVFAMHNKYDNPKISQFGILTGEGYNMIGTGVFGRVQEGLEIARAAAKLDDVQQVIIADCGVMLNF